MRLVLFSIFSTLLLRGLAQDTLTVVSDSVAMNAPLIEDVTDSIPERITIKPVISIDYGKLLSTAAGIDKRYEGAFQLLLNDRIEFIGEYGIADLSPKNAYTNGEYTSSGSYYRLGVGVYSKLNAKSKIGIGLRYGAAKFKDKGVIEIESGSGLQGNFSIPFERTNNLSANWWSMVMTSESKIIFKKGVPDAKINQLVALGFQFRMRFLIAYDRQNPIDVFSIPGYGNTIDDQRAALNFFIKIYPF